MGESDETAIVPATSSLPDLQEELKKENRRKLAAALDNELAHKTFAETAGKKLSKRQYLSRMLSELLTNGVTHTLEGEELRPASFKEWLDLVKFSLGHLEGPVPQHVEVDHQISFKVYAGIDVDKV